MTATEFHIASALRPLHAGGVHIWLAAGRAWLGVKQNEPTIGWAQAKRRRRGALSWRVLHRVTPPISSLRFAGVGLLWADEAVSTCPARNHLRRKYPKRRQNPLAPALLGRLGLEKITSPSATFPKINLTVV
jgi:hypothetical protein